jgi:hypothetical protein
MGVRAPATHRAPGGRAQSPSINNHSNKDWYRPRRNEENEENERLPASPTLPFVFYVASWSKISAPMLSALIYSTNPQLTRYIYLIAPGAFQLQRTKIGTTKDWGIRK